MIAQLPDNMQSKITLQLCSYVSFCWTWTGARNSKGYGSVGVNGKSQLAHRVAYELLVGEIPAGLQIDHLCRNKACCNPAHLEPVTAKVNTRRAIEAVSGGRCKRGHAVAGPNLVIFQRGEWEYRACRMCRITLQREARERKRGGTRLRRRPSVLPLRDANLLDSAERALAAGAEFSE